MRERTTRLDQLTAFAMLLIAFCFVVFGPVWGWRAIGLVFAIQGTLFVLSVHCQPRGMNRHRAFIYAAVLL